MRPSVTPPMPYATRIVHQAAAHCLAYPDAELHERLPPLRSALDTAHGTAADELRPLLDHLARSSVHELTAGYVCVFDFRNRHSLHLSWWLDGDTRRRGASLVRFKDVYRAHGLALAGEELPDFLPAVPEFSARTGSDALLREHRPGLELLRIALAEAHIPYAHALTAVCATLPGPSPKDRAAARALARSGPPREDVGLDPYGHATRLPLPTGEG